MTRLTRRSVVRGLRAPVPAPPEDLGPRIKQQIPDDLFGERSAARHLPPARRRATWAIAASLVGMVGSGYLALRLFEERRDVEPLLASFEAPQQRSSELPTASRAKASSELDQSEATAHSAEPIPLEESREPEPQDRKELVESRLAAPTGDAVASEAAAPALEVEADRSAAAAQPVAAPDSAPAPATAPLPPAAARPAPAPPDGVEDGAASARATSTDRSLADAVEQAEESDREAAVTDALVAALDRRDASPSGAITVEGAMRTPGRVVLLLTALLGPADEAGRAPELPSAVVVELDPKVARRYQLLASHVEALAAEPASGGGASPSSYRVAGLYEIELVRDRVGAATLGNARLADGDRSRSASTRRVLEAGDLAGDWDQAPAELRLAVLAAELARLPADATATRLAPIRKDLERLLADGGLDEATARRAGELQAIAMRSTPPLSTALGRAAAPARNDG